MLWMLRIAILIVKFTNLVLTNFQQIEKASSTMQMQGTH